MTEKHQGSTEPRVWATHSVQWSTSGIRRPDEPQPQRTDIRDWAIAGKWRRNRVISILCPRSSKSRILIGASQCACANCWSTFLNMVKISGISEYLQSETVENGGRAAHFLAAAHTTASDSGRTATLTDGIQDKNHGM